MLVSVVVPAVNEDKYLARCLRALACQEHQGFQSEVIVVDGGSTDGTVGIARRYGARVVAQGRRGVADARQLGFQAARGEIIASTDADSEPPPHWLARLVAALRSGPDVVGVYGPIRLYDGKRYEDALSHYLGGAYLHLNALIGRPAFSGQNFAVWRSDWESVGGFDTDWVSAEDVNLSLKLRFVGRVKFCWDIQVATSSRRVQEGYGRMLWHTAANYIRVVWLKAAPLPFSDIR